MSWSSIPLGNLGPTGLLAVVVLLILIGKLVPRKTHQDVINDRNRWQEAHAISETARIEALRQNDKLLEVARTMEHFIESFPKPLALERSNGVEEERR